MWARLQVARSGAEFDGDGMAPDKDGTSVLIYHSLKKSHEHMLWCSNTSADGAVGTYSPSNHLIPVDNDLTPVDNNFMHYVL